MPHSRYLLRCQAVERTDTAQGQAIFEAAFRKYGLPQAIRTGMRRKSVRYVPGLKCQGCPRRFRS